MEAGVDTANQRVAEYCSQQSSKKWYMCLFTQYLDIAINNAFVFHCLALKKYTEDTCTDGKYHFHGLLDFKATLVDELLARGRVVVPTHAPVLSAVTTLAKATGMPGYTAPSTAGFHMPVFLRRVSKSGTDKPVVGTCSYASCPTPHRGGVIPIGFQGHGHASCWSAGLQQSDCGLRDLFNSIVSGRLDQRSGLFNSCAPIR